MDLKRKKNKVKEPATVNKPLTGGQPEHINDIIKGLKEPDRFINVPKTLLKKEEWGMLTVLSLILAGLFPPYFVNILLISFFTEVGHLYTTHITELERKRLIEFEKEFRVGFDLEKQSRWREAITLYETLVPRYKDNKKIAGIAIQRVDWIEKNHHSRGK